MGAGGVVLGRLVKPSALVALVVTAVVATPAVASAAGIDLATYHRVGRFDLPALSATTPPADSLLAGRTVARGTLGSMRATHRLPAGHYMLRLRYHGRVVSVPITLR